MRFTYKFFDNFDTIDSKILGRSLFLNLIKEIKEINKNYNYTIYVYGSYLDYLIDGSKYNDINFIALLNDKMVNLDELTDFMKSFHLLCKNNDVGYDLKFSLDLMEDMINTNNKNNILFNGEIGIISLYQYKNNDEKLKSVENSELFSGTWDYKKINDKMIDKVRIKVNFNIPVKIS